MLMQKLLKIIEKVFEMAEDRALTKALTSEKVKNFIEEKYSDGTVIPAF